MCMPFLFRLPCLGFLEVTPGSFRGQLNNPWHDGMKVGITDSPSSKGVEGQQVVQVGYFSRHPTLHQRSRR